MRQTTIGMLAAGTIAALPAGASDYQEAWGPPVGAEMPPITALDQSGTPRDLANLAGARGMLLFMVRSADW